MPMAPQTRMLCTRVCNMSLGPSGTFRPTASLMSSVPMRTFATKKDEKTTEEAPVKKRRGRPPKAAKLEASEAEPAPAKKTRTVKAKKLIADLEGAGDATMSEAMMSAASSTKKTTKKTKVASQKPINMYVLKFNTPILPYAKFPLTHNRYIQEFVKMYEEDKEKVDRIIGVHFP